MAQCLFEIVSIHLTLLLMENCLTLEQISREQIIQRSLRSLKSGFHMIATITEGFFSSDGSDRSYRSDHMETSLHLKRCELYSMLLNMWQIV